ncbi:MAG: hypothetical protein H7256_00515 [Bdellovibrio sp.]|nr:hypothetical protein [Bdellovibrio sp.]
MRAFAFLSLFVVASLSMADGLPSAASANGDDLSLFFQPNAALISFKEANTMPVLPLPSALNFNPLKGFVKWNLNEFRCADCAIKVVAKNPFLLTNDVYQFLMALGDEKAELQELYGIHGQEYNLLAQMAVGILGRESNFFQSKRYLLKEKVPALIGLAKAIVSFAKGREINNNSRGPTQIKIVPTKIEDHYGIQPEELKDPKKSAIATMGFLINALDELRRQVRIRKITYITKDKIVDYLPYIYFGAARAIYNRTATPEKNAYVQEMRKYMTWVDVYEYHPELNVKN